MPAAQRQEPRPVHPAAALGPLPRPARAPVVAPGRGARRVEVDVAESHRQHHNTAGFAMTVRGERTGAEQHSGRGSVHNPVTLAVLIFVPRSQARMRWETGLPPGLSRLRDQKHIAAVPCRRARIPSRPRPRNSWTADHARAPLRAAVGRHRRHGPRFP